MQLSCPQTDIGKNIKKAAHQRARVFIVLSRERQPLRKKPIRLESITGGLIEVRRVKIRHPSAEGGGGYSVIRS